MNILVIGLGYFGESLAVELSRMGHEVLGVDTDMAVVQRNASRLAHTMQMDGTDLEALRGLEIPSFDICIVGRGSILQESVLITLNLKELEARYIIAKALTDPQRIILERLGANQIVQPERNMGKRLAHMIGSSTETLDYMDIPGDYCIEEIAAPQDWWGRSLRDLRLPSRYGLHVLVAKSGDQLKALPEADTVIRQGDVLIVFGRGADFAPLKR